MMLVSGEKREKHGVTLFRAEQTLDNRELDAVFVEAVDQCCFCESSSGSVHSSSGNK